MSSTADRAGLAAFLLLSVLPVIAGLGYAALYGFGLAGLLGQGFTLEHWGRVLASREARASFALSLGVASAVGALTAALALPLALLLRERLERGRLTLLLATPLAVPWVVAGFLALQLLSGAGLLSRLLFRLGLSPGIDSFPALVHDRFGIGIALTHALLALPYFTLLGAAIHRSERIPALVEVARNLGASPRQAALRVELPILLRRSAPSLALLFAVVLGSYEVPQLIGSQSPQMISVLVLRRYALFDIGQKPEAFVLALLYSLLVLALVGAALRRQPAFDQP